MEIEVFDAIDRLLRDLMSNDVPFGGKVIVLGGDFRQILPVVKKGTPTEIIEKCVLHSPFMGPLPCVQVHSEHETNC